jgi:transcription initiation factor TFIID subunit 6
VTESLGNLAVLTNMAKLESALLSNKNLFPELYLHQMLPPLLTCVVSKALTSDPSEDHWALRRLAAATVATVCHKFGDK